MAKTELVNFLVIFLIEVLSVGCKQYVSRNFWTHPSSEDHQTFTKCPTPECVTRNNASFINLKNIKYHGIEFEEENFEREKRNILKNIQEASNKRIDSDGQNRLSSSFSQGYIDLGSRNPKDEGAATLAFVFDTTGSMYDDLKQVIEGAGKILKTVLDKYERPIHDYVLVPFNDPDVGKLTMTSDPEQFKSSLHELQYFIQGGGDCPEMAVTAIKMALEVCLPSSYIYVFTDARAKDYFLLANVLELIQKKHAQVIFVMTGDCGNKTHPGYQAFETIASTSSGQVLHLNKSDVDEVLNFIEMSLESRKVNLLSVDRTANEAGDENIELLVDQTLKEFTISVSGEKPRIEIFRPDGGRYGKEKNVDELLTLENVKIVGVKQPTPGRYNIAVGSDSKFTVRATGLSSIDFQTGFSLNPTTNIKETYHRPMKGGKSHVLVKPIDETEFGDLHRLQLISLDGKPLVDIPLKRLPGKDTIFQGIPITSPDQPFNIKIFGRDKSGFDFERISPTAVTSQLPSPPEVVAEEEIIGFYDREAKITCHVQTLVPFNVTWKIDGIEIPELSEQHLQSAEVHYIIKKPTTSDEGVYTCSATNIAGSAMGNIFVDIKEPPPNILVQSNFSLTPNEPGVLTCQVTSTVAFNVSWAKYAVKGQVKDFFGRTETVGEFIPIEKLGNNYIQLSNDSLFIEEVTKDDRGWYRCSATNEGGTRAKEIFLQAQEIPEVSVFPESATFQDGSNLTLKCMVGGVQSESVFWFKGERKLYGNEPRITINSNNSLHFINMKKNEEGIYTCLAENAAGRSEDSAKLAYTEPAEIVAVEKEVLAESGENAILECYADGIPLPTVKWFRSDFTEVVQKSFVEIKDGILRISGVQERDADTYTCFASNGIGSSEDTVVLNIGSSPTVLQKPGDQRIDIGGTGGLSCYGDGVPPPLVTWRKENNESLPSHFTQEKSGTLRINGMQLEDEGIYICTLENIYGKKEIKTRLVVSGLLAPLIAAPVTPRLKAVAPEPVVIPCTIIMANPPAEIYWYHKGSPVKLKDGMFVSREGDLHIPNVSARNEGNYECIASNVAGNSSLSLFLDVLEPPVIKEGRQQQEVKTTKGSKVKLKCPVKADPKPTYSWQRNGQPVMPFQRRLRIVSDGTLIIRNVKPEDGGVYVCTAVNRAGATNTAITLHIHVPPRIAKDSPTQVVFEDEETELPCSATGSPAPTIQWIKKGDFNVNLNSTIMADGSLRLYGSSYTEGIYECTATNDAGSSKRIVELIVNKPPVILEGEYEENSDIEILEGEAMKLFCRVEGHPKPKVIWTKNDRRIAKSERIKLREDHLLLKDVSTDMNGQYTCIATNRAGSETKSFLVDIKYPPYTEVDESLKKDLIEGSSISLPCSMSGNPLPTRMWVKDNETIYPGNRIFFKSDGTLEIEGARRHHSGLYECIMSNKFGKANITYDLTVMVPPKVSKWDMLEIPETVEGHEVKIKCPVDAFPIPTIEWFKNGIHIFSTKDRADVTHIIVEENGRTLHIFEATVDDEGLYRCVVKNPAGETFIDFPLEILVPPHLTTFFHEPNIVVHEGEEVELDCVAKGDPHPKIVWEKNGFKLPPLYPQVSADGDHIRISRVTHADSGLYTCTATNSAGFTSRNFNLTVHAPPTISYQQSYLPKEVIAVMGQDAEIECKVTGNPEPTITWSLDNVSVENIIDLKFTLKENNQMLVLHDLKPKQSGTYICNATNIVGSSLKMHNISVFTPPFVGEEDDFTTEIEDVRTNVNQDLKLNCMGGGFPEPKYSWFWKDRPLSHAKMSYNVNGSVLTLNRVRIDNKGKYTCLAVNPAGSAEKHFNVAVHVPAKIGNEENTLRTMKTFETTTDTPVSLYCPAFGFPEPIVEWRKDGETLKKQMNSTALETSFYGIQNTITFSDNGKRITFSKPSSNDSGIYTCVAENIAGTDAIDFFVSVLDPPKIVAKSNSPMMIREDFPLTLNCEFKGTPSPAAKWLFNEEDLDHLPVEGVNIEEAENQINLKVDHISKQHVGTYTCLVSSVAGTDEAIFEITVATIPKIDKNAKPSYQPIISRANRPITFECRIDSFPPPVFQWLLDGSPIDISSKRYHISHDKSVLKILLVEPKDSGKYSCLGANSVGFTTRNFTLKVQVPPRLTKIPEENPTFEEGDFIKLFCPIESTPPPTIIWMKDSKIIRRPITSRDPKYLVLEKASRENQGRYTCIATNEAGTLEQSFNLNVLVPPKLENINKAVLEESVVVNRQVTMSCFIVPDPDLTMKWYKDGKEVKLYSGRTVNTSGRQISIMRTELEDAGEYTCTATNSAGQINTTTILSVLSPPTWKNNDTKEQEIFGIKNSKLELDCDVGGVPPPSLIWFRKSQLLENDTNQMQFINNGRKLVIFRAHEKDSGQYSCIASNAAGTLEKNLMVTIHRPPYLSHLPSSKIQVLRNRPVHLTCPVRGEPDPQIHWTINGETLQKIDENLQYSNRKRDLHILRASGSGNVTVTCHATNIIGDFETEFTLEVLTAPSIVPYPSVPSVSAVEGDKIKIKCEASGYPTPKIFWSTESGTLILPEDTFALGMKIDETGETLTFLEVHADQQGKYTCSAANEGGIVDFTFNIIVNLAPVIQEPANGPNFAVQQNSFLVLKCNVDARPKAVIKWYKDGESLHVSQDPFLYLTNHDQHLKFLRIVDYHAGIYSCIANNEAGHDELQFQVDVLLPPTIVEHSNEAVEVLEGDRFELECETEGKPPPLVTWSKGQIILSPSSRREFLSNTNDHVLIVKKSTLSDTGNYICKAFSQVGTAEIQFHVDVYSPPKILETEPNNQNSFLSESHKLHCDAKGTPEPLISWTRRGSTINSHNDPNFQLINNGKELMIMRVREVDGGVYTCVAASLSGQASKNYQLNVFVPPTIQRANQPDIKLSVVGKWVELSCETIGNPKPDIVWKKDGFSLPEVLEERIQIIGGNNNLRISNIQLIDSGIYTCEAANEAGIDRRNLTLQVMVPPKISDDMVEEINVKEGTNVAITCPIEAFPEPSYMWTKNYVPVSEDGIGNLELRDFGQTLKIVRIDRKDADVYICFASNAAGNLEHATNVKVVVPPMILGAENRKNEILKVIEGGHVTFECPLSEGQPVPTRFWYSGNNKKPVNHTISGNGESMIIFKAILKDDGIYQCIAENDYGISIKTFKLEVLTPPVFDFSSIPEEERKKLIFEREAPIYLPPDGRPRQTSAKAAITIVEGSAVKIQCPIKGTPFPRILWYEGSHALSPSPRIVQNSNDSSLMISKTISSDAKDYTCVGVNPAGEAELSVALIVEVQPIIMGDPEVVLPAVPGESVSMDCKLATSGLRKRAIQKVDFKWLKNGENLSDDLKESNKKLFKKSIQNETTIFDYEFLGLNDLKKPSEINDKSTSQYILSRDLSKLTIPRVTSEAKGEYECQATNAAGVAKKSFQINILSPPSISTHEGIRKYEAAVGEPVVFECNASGQPPPEITWYKNDAPIKSGYRHQFLENSQVLIIQFVQEGDDANYSCYATNAAGTSVETFSLNVLVPPSLSGQVEDRIEIVSGDSIEISCEIKGNPPPDIVWSFDNENIQAKEELVQASDGTLFIASASQDLAGEYVCDGTNVVGRTFKIVHLFVKEGASIHDNHVTDVETVIEGDSTTLHCIASGQPIPILSWQKDGTSLRLNERVSVSWGGRTLLLHNIQMEDAGEYSCMAFNSAGNDTKHFKLKVLQPPKITEGPNTIVAIEGESITAFCSVAGTPFPKITWYHGEEIIEKDVKEINDITEESLRELPLDIQRDIAMVMHSRRLLVSGGLQFSPILPEHDGNYTCAADNEAGRAIHSFSVAVLLPPQAYLEVTPSVATAGDQVELLCKVEGSRPIAFSWMKGREPLRPGAEIQFAANGTLKIPFVTVDMAGSYTCTAKNPAGIDEVTETLTVQEIPNVSAVTKEIIVAAGKEAELMCRVYGEPMPSVTWSRPDLGGKQITPENSRIQMWENKLQISPVLNEDMGTYRCTGTNRAGSDHANLALVVTSGPTIAELLEESMTVVLGESIDLSCTATSGYPPPSVIWRKEGRLIKPNPRIKFATNGQIVIENVKGEDSGMYSCLVVNAAGRLYRVVTVVVEVPPRIAILPKTQEVAIGDSFYLECESIGVPIPNISWLLNGEEVEGASSSFGGRGRLDIQRAAKSDEGTYTCLARNSAGHRKAIAAIRVKVPPVIMNSPEEMTVQELSSVVLTCLARGDPYPAITWTKEGHYIAASERVHIMPNGSLIIDGSKGSDAGEYKCIVSNDAGAAEAVSHLTVLMAPTIIKGPLSVEVDVGDTVLFNCVADGEPAPNIQWSLSNKDMNERFNTLTNGSLQVVATQVEDEGQVICQVYNDLGEDLAKANLLVRVNGMWGDWGPWDKCSTTCGVGKQIRMRSCDSPSPRNGGKSCAGEQETSRPCRLKGCPVNGRWSLWSRWGECIVSCGGGTRVRKHVCNNPAPLNGGQDCEGPEVVEMPCNTQKCPVNGDWSLWSEWSECSRSCGEALRQRTRICNNPPPSHGGLKCEDNGLEIIPCENEACAIHGNWGAWDEWSPCSKHCGDSSRYRKRKCNNPPPEYGGDDCLGEGYTEEPCDVPACIIHGEWSSWTGWSGCSVTCSRGHRERKRLCDNPPPKDGGEKCPGPDVESQPCSSSPCPVNGNWGDWGDWSSCSKTCGSGVRGRTRKCNSPYPRNGGKTCQGSANDNIICEDLSCKDLPIRAYGTLRGGLNGEDLGVISLSGNVTTNGNQRTLVMSMSPLRPQFATWLTPLATVVSSAIWSSAFEVDDAVNGNTLTKSNFKRKSSVSFGNGEKVNIIQTANGLDETGTLRFDIEVEGDVPYLPPGSFVTIQPYSEDYIQTGRESLYVKSSRTFSVSGFHHPFHWNETIHYDPSNGHMPSLIQTLHANSVSASYRCLSGIDQNNARGELSVMISSVIMPSKEEKCPSGFTLLDEDDFKICQDNNECFFNETGCSHTCRNTVGSFHCECPDGYMLSDDLKICEDIDECVFASSSCGPREKCVNTQGSFTCKYSCGVGFRRKDSGTACEDIDECVEENNCNQGCQNLLGSYRCKCYKGYSLEVDGTCIDINECVLYGTPCSHECTNVPGSFKCSCPKGYQLLNNGRCKDINECATLQAMCPSGEVCENTKGGFECVSNCPEGLSRTRNGSCTDVDECSTQTANCHFTQHCINTWGTYRCTCQRGYRSIGPGHPCIDMNECLNSPPPCNFECRNVIGDYECICPPGMRRLRNKKTCVAIQYDNEYQEYRINNHPRYNPRRPQRPQSFPRYPLRDYPQPPLRRVYRLTDCPDGFSANGDECEDIDECRKPGRCQHACENTHGSFHCLCPPGYQLSEDKQNCEDIDECNKNNSTCRGEQICVNFKGSYRCEKHFCPKGYKKGTQKGYCLMDCHSYNKKCPAGVKGTHYLIQKWVSISSGILGFEDLAKLIPINMKGEVLPHLEFKIIQKPKGTAFRIRQENGIGILSTMQRLESGQEYRLIVEANSYDAKKIIIKYSTIFNVILHISEYPF